MINRAKTADPHDALLSARKYTGDGAITLEGIGPVCGLHEGRRSADGHFRNSSWLAESCLFPAHFALTGLRASFAITRYARTAEVGEAEHRLSHEVET